MTGKLIKLVITLTIIVLSIGYSIKQKKNLWAMEDEDLFDLLMNGVIDKSAGGRKMKKLNDYERTFMIVSILHTVVLDRGFYGLLKESGEGFDDLLVPCAKAVNAPEVAEICARALPLFYKDIDEDSFVEELDACDEDYLQLADEARSSYLRYARENKKHFKVLQYNLTWGH